MNLIRHSVVRFALVGISNTAVGFGTILLALRGFGFGDVAANATGNGVGFLWSFFLNRSWTFHHRGGIGSGFVRFALVCLVAYLANLIVVVLLSDYLGPGRLATQFGGMVVYTAVGYLGSRLYAFPVSEVPAHD